MGGYISLSIEMTLNSGNDAFYGHATNGPPTTGPAGPSTTDFVAIDGPAGPSMAAMDGPA